MGFEKLTERTNDPNNDYWGEVVGGHVITTSVGRVAEGANPNEQGVTITQLSASDRALQNLTYNGQAIVQQAAAPTPTGDMNPEDLWIEARLPAGATLANNQHIYQKVTVTPRGPVPTGEYFITSEQGREVQTAEPTPARPNPPTIRVFSPKPASADVLRGQPWLQLGPPDSGNVYYGDNQGHWIRVPQATANNQQVLAPYFQHIEGVSTVSEGDIPATLRPQIASFPGRYQQTQRQQRGPQGGRLGGAGPAANATQNYTNNEYAVMSQLGSLSEDEKHLFLQERFPLPRDRHGAIRRDQRALNQRDQAIAQFLDQAADQRVPPTNDVNALRQWLGNRGVLHQLDAMHRDNANLTPQEAYTRLRGMSLLSDDSPAPPQGATWPAGFFEPNNISNPRTTLPFSWKGRPSSAESARTQLREPVPTGAQQAQGAPGGYVESAQIQAAVQREQMEQTACLEIIKILMEWAGKLQQLMLEGTKNIPQTVAAVSQAMQRQR